MRLVITRVKEASCLCNNILTKINHGFLILIGFKKDDSNLNFDKMIKKIENLRIFEDENQKLNKNIKDVVGEILLISQFTLYAACKNGNRPSFTEALEFEKAKSLYLEFYEKLNQVIPTKIGHFGEEMDISSVNYGPVTIILDEDTFILDEDTLYEKS